jgi:biotin operon repressor
MHVFPRPSLRHCSWSSRRVHRVVGCPPHVRVFLDAAGQLAHDQSIQGEAWRVLLLLLSLVDDDHRVIVSTAALAAHLTMPRQNIWRALTTLAQAGYVQRNSQDVGIQLRPHMVNRSLASPEEGPQAPYVRVWQNHALRQLAADKTLHAADLRVFGKVLAGMQWLNVVHLYPPQWGQELGMARQTVSRSLQVLLAKGVLLPDSHGRQTTMDCR